MNGSAPGPAPGPAPSGAAGPGERSDRDRVVVRLGVFVVALLAAVGVGAAVGALLPERRAPGGPDGTGGGGTGTTATTAHDMEGHR